MSTGFYDRPLRAGDIARVRAFRLRPVFKTLYENSFSSPGARTSIVASGQKVFAFSTKSSAV